MYENNAKYAIGRANSAALNAPRDLTKTESNLNSIEETASRIDDVLRQILDRVRGPRPESTETCVKPNASSVMDRLNFIQQSVNGLEAFAAELAGLI